jgi:hypothetical protein
MVSGDKSVICKQEIVKGTAILNAINNKCCLSFQTKSWIIFHLQGKDFTCSWIAKLNTLRHKNIHLF